MEIENDEPAREIDIGLVEEPRKAKIVPVLPLQFFLNLFANFYWIDRDLGRSYAVMRTVSAKTFLVANCQQKSRQKDQDKWIFVHPYLYYNNLFQYSASLPHLTISVGPANEIPAIYKQPKRRKFSQLILRENIFQR